MTPDAIRSALKAEPFEPFAIQLDDGQTFRVPHPEFVLAPKGSRTIVVHEGGDRDRLLNAFLIASLNFDKPRKSRSNGKRRKAG
jgi:hypothetical protein